MTATMPQLESTHATPSTPHVPYVVLLIYDRLG